MNTYVQSAARRLPAAALSIATAVAAAGLAVAVPGTAQAQTDGCVVVEKDVTVWWNGPDQGGFLLTITLTNVCDEPVEGWTLGLQLAPGHTPVLGWNAAWSWSGPDVVAADLGWNAVLHSDQPVSLGLQGIWAGEYADPVSCTVNGAPCAGEPDPGEPPEVVLTSPQESEPVPAPGTVTLAADAHTPGGTIDRVEFYLDGELVGTADSAPYQVAVPLLATCTCTAVARAFDGSSPPVSADSPPVTFQPVRVPPLPIIMEPAELEIEAGSSAVVNVRLGVETSADIEMTVTGDPGVTVSPESFTIDSADWNAGQDVTVDAAAGAAGATATVIASEVAGSASVPVTVVDPG